MPATPHAPKPLTTALPLGGRVIRLPFPMTLLESSGYALFLVAVVVAPLFRLVPLSDQVFEPGLLRALLPLAWIIVGAPAVAILANTMMAGLAPRRRWETYRAQDGQEPWAQGDTAP